ncbi:MAG: glycosyltransferase family 39 protein [Bacteroidetes bacterium]|nr:MAG: glycosyltransferase family 39 protein [Bacteroidota bacterium]
MGLFKRWSINLIFALAGLVYLLGMLVEIMDVDSAQYALISREMLESGNFLEVYLQGNNYLDKPPLLFWISALSFKLFGYANWSFRLGSVLFSAVGVISTYKLGNLLYNKRIGFVAALMLMSSQAFISMNQDVRTDTILASAVVLSVWQLTEFLYYKQKRNLVWGFVGIAIAMMTKGPIGLMVPILALGSYAIGRKRYRDLFKVEWLIGLGITLVLLLPMSYGLYTQFDQHPEKVLAFNSDAGVVRKDSVSGLKFYFWDQSFGRITGENVWSNDSGPDFFIHTFLWSFIPWSILAVWAIFWRVIVTTNDIIKGQKKQEWLTLGGFILPFIAFSLSQYKLPHYINVILPFAAIITSEFTLRVVYEKSKGWYRAAYIIQGLNILALILIYALCQFWFFPDTAVPWTIFGVFGLGTGVYFYWKGAAIDKLILSTLFCMLTANVYLNGQFYPELMKYQPSDRVAADIKRLNIDEDHFFVSFPPGGFSLAYYTGFNLTNIREESLDTTEFPRNSFYYGSNSELEMLREHGIDYQVIHTYPTFHVTKLSLQFLNPETRNEVVGQANLVKLLP